MFSLAGSELLSCEMKREARTTSSVVTPKRTLWVVDSLGLEDFGGDGDSGVNLRLFSILSLYRRIYGHVPDWR